MTLREDPSELEKLRQKSPTKELLEKIKEADREGPPVEPPFQSP